MPDIYVVLENGEIVRSPSYADNVNMDLSAKDKLLGVEVLGAEDVEIDGVSAVGMKDVLSTIYPYVNWTDITKHLTNEQREVWADVIDAHFDEIDPKDPGEVPRWWKS